MVMAIIMPLRLMEHIYRLFYRSRFLLFVVFLSIPLLSANVVKNVEVFKRTDRIDVLFTFDGSFNENISQRDGTGYRTVVLKNVPYNGVLEENINALGVEEIKVFGQNGDLYLMVIGPKTPSITASKTANSFGLRIRIKEMDAPQSATQSMPVRNSTLNANLPSANEAQSDRIELKTNESNASQGVFSQFSSETFSYNQYLAMIGVMIAILLLLLFWRKRGLDSGGTRSSGGWLFGQKQAKNLNDIEIIAQKPLDIKNRFVTIESGGFRYLILVGQSGNTLIDRYQVSQKPRGDDYIEGEESFEQLLERKRDNLLNYLGENRKLDEFREKARRY